MDVTEVKARGDAIIAAVARAVVGKENVLRQVLVGILAGGHILFEDYPGLAKTLVARSFAQVLGLSFRRIQFTPDLLPSDITGSHVFDREHGRFTLSRGPIFANLILADEINRATPKTQSALLEAMQESQVTVGGETHPLAPPFIVLATQNPIEYEGTFPLPEAQLDRFLMRLSIGYPSREAEIEVLQRRRERRADDIVLSAATSGEELLAMRSAAEEVFVERDLEGYMVDLVSRTRADPNVYVGASPRGALALLKLARARAALDGRAYTLPDDVKEFAVPALAHRLILSPELWSKRITPARVVEGILGLLPVPKVD